MSGVFEAPLLVLMWKYVSRGK